ncbi:outer membrane beta-barrel protein [Hymenobacter arizonensis]|uniref:outer membrane beta-barrel protein n=1 Tax=Hymenobacter arizonensis TaxID=1227077 RepID=UPI0015A583AA|nr:outer membrane beta-barrel protein [Hymenobacter arizonensis]
MVFLLVASTTLRAQPIQSGQLRGTVLEALTAKPVPFADILLLRQSDSTLVTSGQTAIDGTFLITVSTLGTYLLKTQALNFRSNRRVINLTLENPSISLATLYLEPSATRLDEVKVIAQKATLERQLGKVIIDVEKELNSVGGMATDLLRNVPSVAVDASGVVSLRGSSSLTILIDGKPAGVNNGGIGGTRLDQIPASQIARIELITNPSAKYDAQGSGVINIILKNNSKPGVNGQINLTVGTQRKYFGDLALNFQRGRANWNVNYSRQDQSYNERTENGQRSTMPTGLVQTTQIGEGVRRRQRHDVRIGLNYALNKQQSFTLQVNPSWEPENNVINQQLTTLESGKPELAQQSKQWFNANQKVLQNIATYRHTWEKHQGRELTSAAGLVRINAVAPITLVLDGVSPLGWQQNVALLANISFIQVDYAHPFAALEGKLESGIKMQRQSSTGSSTLSNQLATTPVEYAVDSSRSYTYRYRQLVSAAYATYSCGNTAKDWQLQVGLRTEDTNTKGEAGVASEKQNAFQIKYLELFPSLTFGYGLGRADTANGGMKPQRLQVSYARRLSRPEFLQQLAVPFYSDPRSYRLGNPALLAEFSHNLELSHQASLPHGFDLTTSFFAIFTQNAIQRLRSIDVLATNLNPAAGLVVAETYLNNGKTTSLGLDLYMRKSLAAWWQVEASGSFYRSEVRTNSPSIAGRRLWTGDARLSQNFRATSNLNLQLVGSVRSRALTGQGQLLPSGGVDLALRQHLFANQADLTFRLTDIFNTQIRRTNIETPSLAGKYLNKQETRVAWLGFTWFIGANKAKSGEIEALPSRGKGLGSGD